MSDLRVKILERDIASYEEYLKEPPTDSDPELIPQYEQDLAALKLQRAEMLISEAEKRVQRNPTDLHFKFELGQQLMGASRFKEAIPQLQQARKSPNVRLKAMNLLGQCYTSNGMLDMAERQFTEAKGEMGSMDDLKKEVTYRLGLVYEKMGKADKSLECMKEIYDSDYGYMDVAKRVETSYQQ